MKKRNDPKLEKLIGACRKQDRKAQYEVYQLYAKAMLNTAFRIVQDDSEAEDVLQDAFLAAFSTLDRYRGESTFGAWLKRIVVNKSIDALKKKKAQFVPIEEARLIPDTDQEPGGSRYNVPPGHLRQAIDALPDGYRVVFSLYLLEGYDHQEISGILGISESASKSQYSRAKAKLRKMLENPAPSSGYPTQTFMSSSGSAALR
jgi:RNA polymerase sigma factor (sigma-70 family)